jgi:hypothetical protein
VELVSKTGTPSATTSVAALPIPAVSDEGVFGALLAAMTGSSASRAASEANAALPALKAAAALVTTATAASSTDTTSSASTDGGATTSSASAATSTSAATTPYTFNQADQYSPEVMSVAVQSPGGAMSYRPASMATATQLDLANAMAPLDPNATTDGGTINDIAVIGPMSYSVVGYQPRASDSDPLIPIYGPAPTTYT